MFIKLSKEYDEDADYIAIRHIKTIRIEVWSDSLYEFHRLVANLGDEEYDLYHSDKYHVSDWEGYEDINEYNNRVEESKAQCWQVFTELRKLIAQGDGLDIEHIVDTIWENA